MSSTLAVILLFLFIALAIGMIFVLVQVFRSLRQPGRASPSPNAPYLVGLQGSLEGKKYPIPTRGLIIGRHRDNGLRINEHLVSRFHAQITFENDQYFLHDRNSANGTWVNDRRIHQNYALQPDDVIQIGLSHFEFRSPTAIRPSPKPPPRPPIYVRPKPQAGQSFDGYELLEMVGHGGMSTVYRARSTSDGSEVALKILEETEPYVIDKFIQWGKTIGPILHGHPHIASVYRLGHSEDNRLYIVEEFIEGVPLRAELAGRPIRDQRRIIDITGQTCDALHYAHRCGVIHRDIKPENMMLSPDGKVKITDFGIAKLTSAVTITRDKLIGTPEYMSYEQAKGQRVNFASDLYSLGVVLYEMLTGTVPFSRPKGIDTREASMKVIEMHLKDRPRPPRELDPNIPTVTEKITLKALEKDWRKRFRSAEEMSQALGCDQLTPVRPPVGSVASARLVVVQGGQHGKIVQLESVGAGGIALGRRDIDPNDTLISRRHAIVSFQGGQFWLEDTSSNGTYRSGKRLYGEILLQNGDVLLMGNTFLKVEASV